MTEVELEQRARHDHESVLGKVLLVHEVGGLNRDNDSVWPTLTTPARVRVDRTDERLLTRWMEEWLDPIWDVQLVEPHPELEAFGIEHLWMYGTGYSTGGEVNPARYTIEPSRPGRLGDRIRRWRHA